MELAQKTSTWISELSLNSASAKGRTIHLKVYVCSFGTTNRRMHMSHELNVYRANPFSMK